MRLRLSWPLVAALLVGGCGAGEEAESPPAPAEVATPDGPWRLEASATAGTALVHSDEQGVERLRLICRRDPAGLVAQAPSVQPIGSEERFSLGAGDEVFVLVADVMSGRPFVEAKGPLTAEIVAGLEKGPIAANYGTWSLPPQTAPAKVRADFAEACRQALRG